MTVVVSGIEIDLSKVITDSDLEDIAEEYNVDLGELYNAKNEFEVKGTSCERCKNIGYRFSLYPCLSCSRNPDVKDNFECKE